MNCKQGDLAIIISDRESVENVGRLVEVLRPADFTYGGIDGFHWSCMSIGSPLLSGNYCGSRRVGKLEADMHADIPDKCLRPIRPGEVATATERHAELVAK